MTLGEGAGQGSSPRILRIPAQCPRTLLEIRHRGRVSRMHDDESEIVLPADATVGLRLTHPNQVALLEDFAPDAIQFLDLGHPKFDDRALEVCARFHTLTRLHAIRTRITDAGLSHLRELRSLEWLFLGRSRISDHGLGSIQELRLSRLHLDNTRVGDAGVKYLSGMESLQVLGLSGTKVTDAALEYLGDLSKLRHLGLAGTAVTDAGLQPLGRLDSLQVLVLTSTQVRGPGVVHLPSDVEVALPHDIEPDVISRLRLNRPDLILGSRRILQSSDSLRLPQVEEIAGPVEIITRSGEPVATDSIRIAAGVPTLLHFWADWCAPCRPQKQHVVAASEDLGGRLRLVRIDVEANPAAAKRHRVASIPTLLLLVQGRERLRLTGGVGREVIREEVRAVLRDYGSW